MSYKANDYQQMSMDDSFLRLPLRTQKTVLSSWAKYFSEEIFPAIDEEHFSVLFSGSKGSRPNCPINIVVGGLILKEIIGLTDEELSDNLRCDIRYQYALHTTQYAEQPASESTFFRFRQRVYRYEKETGTDLFAEETKRLSPVIDEFARKYFYKKHMSSDAAADALADTSRMEQLYHAIAGACAFAIEKQADVMLPETLQHYTAADDFAELIYRCAPDTVTAQWEQLKQDGTQLQTIFCQEGWQDSAAFQLLWRILIEQV